MHRFGDGDTRGIFGGEKTEKRRNYISFLFAFNPKSGKKELHLFIYTYPNITIMHCFPN